MDVHRNDAYVDSLLGKIRAAWVDSPWMHLGELLSAVVGSQSVAATPDDQLADDLDEWLESLETWSPR